MTLIGGGKSFGGKRGRGTPKKTPFLAAVSKFYGKPDKIKLSVIKCFRTNEIKCWSGKSMETGSSVLSDGLTCFRDVIKAGLDHHNLVAGNSRDSNKTVAFDWVNTVLRNLKTTLTETFYKLSAHHLQRHLTTFQYRFNRCYRVKNTATIGVGSSPYSDYAATPLNIDCILRVIRNIYE